MSDQEKIETLRERYRTFASFEAKGISLLYEAFSNAVARNDAVLERLLELPKLKQQPNLLLAAVRLEHGVAANEDEFCDWVVRDWEAIKQIMLARSTQTNEPGRCALLLPVLARLPQPVALLEVGAAAGLCLYPDKYAYDYGDKQLRTPGNPPVFRCKASGNTPLPDSLPRVAWRGGIDLNPLSVLSDDDMHWLRLLVWPEQTERIANLDRAIRIVQGDPPNIVTGDLLEHLASSIAAMPEDATRVVFHSAVLGYLPARQRRAFASVVAAQDVTWISNEHPAVLPEVAARLAQEPPGNQFMLSVNGHPAAFTGPHGQSITWL